MSRELYTCVLLFFSLPKDMQEQVRDREHQAILVRLYKALEVQDAANAGHRGECAMPLCRRFENSIWNVFYTFSP